MAHNWKKEGAKNVSERNWSAAVLEGYILLLYDLWDKFFFTGEGIKVIFALSCFTGTVCQL